MDPRYVFGGMTPGDRPIGTGQIMPTVGRWHHWPHYWSTTMYRSVATAPTQSIDAARFLANNSSRHLIPSVTASRYGCCNWAVGTPWRRTNDYHSASLAQALRVFLSADLTKASAPYASTAAITAVNHILDNIQRLPRDSWRAILIDRTACRHDRLLFKRWFHIFGRCTPAL